MLKTLILACAILAAAVADGCHSNAHTHSITVTFDYDFGVNPACSPKVTKDCVRQFNLYDISKGAAKRKKLASFPVPVGASGIMKGVTFTTPPMPLDSGNHVLSITAQMPGGQESDVSKCITSVKSP
jgi:hypothetical protein